MPVKSELKWSALKLTAEAQRDDSESNSQQIFSALSARHETTRDAKDISS